MIATDRNLVAHVYNPDNQTKDQLIDGFVVRLKQFRRVYKEISTDTMQHAEQHILLEGNRGMGKTTMLLRLAYQIENDDKLNTWLIPLVFNEEEYGISRLFKLWERIAILLADKNPEFQGLFEEMDEWYDRYESTETYEYDMFALLSKRLAEKGKKVILFIDNFGDIIAKFKKQEVQRLREVLQTSNKIRIIGASSVVLEAHYDYRHPFYEFFRIVRLRGLNQIESETLLLKLGEIYKQETIKSIIKNQKGRVEALRRLTGGVIRSIVLLFEIFVDKQDGSAFHDLEAILDKATPLYKHRMDDLPAQQQEIIQAIAMAWDAVNTKEIAKITRIPSKTVSAQLRQLEKNELVNKILTSTKNHLYQIHERFFNIWYLMRHGRKGDKNRVLWLVRFLEEWCDKQALEERATAHIGALQAGTYDVRGAYYMTEALAQVKHIPWDIQEELLDKTRKYLDNAKSEFARHVSKSDNEIWEKAQMLVKIGKYNEALALIQKIKVDKENVLGAFYYMFLNDYKKAEQYFYVAIEKGRINAYNNLASLNFNIFENYKKAKKYYLLAIEKGDIHALNNLAKLYRKGFQDFEKAEKYYLLAIEKGLITPIKNLAHLYEYELQDFEKAEKYYSLAIERGDENAQLDLIALVINKKKDLIKALNYKKQLFKKNNTIIIKNTYAKVLIWNKQYKEASEIFSMFCYREDFIKNNEDLLNEFLLVLFANKYYSEAHNYFTSEEAKKLNLKDRLKPMYYATLYYLKDKYLDEYLRMGAELTETVEEIIQKVENLQEEFKDLK